MLSEKSKLTIDDVEAELELLKRSETEQIAEITRQYRAYANVERAKVRKLFRLKRQKLNALLDVLIEESSAIPKAQDGGVL